MFKFDWIKPSNQTDSASLQNKLNKVRTNNRGSQIFFVDISHFQNHKFAIIHFKFARFNLSLYSLTLLFLLQFFKINNYSNYLQILGIWYVYQFTHFLGNCFFKTPFTHLPPFGNCWPIELESGTKTHFKKKRVLKTHSIDFLEEMIKKSISSFY